MTCLPGPAAWGPATSACCGKAKPRATGISATPDANGSGLKPKCQSALRVRDLAQPEMLHLAHDVARQRLDEHDIARDLEAGELARDMGPQRLGIGLGAGTQDHIGDRHLLPFRV